MGTSSHMIRVQDVLPKLQDVTQSGSEWTARCPIAHKHEHNDRSRSLSVGEGKDGKALLKCHTGCSYEEIVDALGLAHKQKPHYPSSNTATVQHLPGCTLMEYAEAKGLSLDFLRFEGLRDQKYFDGPAIAIPYWDEQRSRELATRYRTALTKGADDTDQRFAWRKGSKLALYGLHKLAQARNAGYITIVEGESDCHTLWHHGEPAIGVPGADTWREEWAALLDGIATIYVVVEPDKGGEAVRKWLARSAIRDRVEIVKAGEWKDVSGLYLSDRDNFPVQWLITLDEAIPWAQMAEADAKARAVEAWSSCSTLARQPDILDCFVTALNARGHVGEEQAAKLVYLVLTSRLLDKPSSAVIKGPSSAGKSRL